jgi:hypothetical protein
MRAVQRQDGGTVLAYAASAVLVAGVGVLGLLDGAAASHLSLVFSGVVAAGHAGGMLWRGGDQADRYWSHAIGAVLYALGAGASLAEGTRVLGGAMTVGEARVDLLGAVAGALLVVLAVCVGSSRRAVEGPRREGVRIGARGLAVSCLLASGALAAPLIATHVGLSAAWITALATLLIGFVLAMVSALLLAGSRGGRADALGGGAGSSGVSS